MFLDLNSYFASVEQQLDPKLRGKPVAVVPTMADTTSCIAASYEAKKFGVKCGTNVAVARQKCPDIIFMTGNHPAYVAFHEKVKVACDTVLPIDKVCSIDEMRFCLLGTEGVPEVARELAIKMKNAILDQVGECITSSVGVAPNHFLAKLATDMMKPDGLVILQHFDLPDKLFELKLKDFCGINYRTKIRLNDNQVDKSLSHSHVLPPEHRTEKGCRDVVLRLLHKASARLRANGLWATHMSVYVKGMSKSWGVQTSLAPSQDSVTMTEYFLEMWQSRDFERPLQVGVVFTGLLKPEQVTPSLFDPTIERSTFNSAIDTVNKKFGKHKVFLAGLDKAKHTADEKIAFQKVELFQEGKDDNVWPDTFRGGQAFNG
jgi:DNA polymerase-4